jgi:hypothetical protein
MAKAKGGKKKLSAKKRSVKDLSASKARSVKGGTTSRGSYHVKLS